MKAFLFSFFLLLAAGLYSQKITIEGKILQKGKNTTLPGANIILVETNYGAVSNANGEFFLRIKPGTYTLKVSFIGFLPYEQKISLTTNQTLTIYLEIDAQALQEVVISDQSARQNLENPQSGMVKLSLHDMDRLPAFLGESDPIRAIRLTPGVQAGGEGNAGIFVRGGSPGQNLILLEDMPLYNPSHLLGLYSVFNPGIVKNVSLYKGAFPANYGGKASSVMRIVLNDGIPEKTELEGSLGLISSRLCLRVPLFNGKAAFLFGARSTYLEVYQPIFDRFLSNKGYIKNTRYGFYDLNARFEIRISGKDRIILNSYLGVDRYKLLRSRVDLENTMIWGNRAASLKWLHTFNPGYSWSNIIGITSYDFNLDARFQNYGIKLNSGITDPFFRSEIMYTTEKHFIQTGIEATGHSLNPGSFDANADENEIISHHHFRSAESSAYINDTYNVNQTFSVIGGIRLTGYAHLGKYDRYITNLQGITDTIHYKNNEIVKKYGGVEPRLSAIYKESENVSWKTSLSRNYQFIHLISVGTVSLPTDIWFPSTLLVKPEYSDQVTLGYFRNFENHTWEGSCEIYYKHLYNQVEFKNSLMTRFKNNEFEEDIACGSGNTYGAEWYLRKNSGLFTGWVSYTLAWSVRKFTGLNEGKAFYAKYDRRHELALTLQYQINELWSVSSVFIYSTGNAMTLPSGRYMIQGNVINDYTATNSFRMPPYHRLDISATRTRKIKTRYESSWNFSIYNTYNRANPYYVFFEVRGNLDEYTLSVKAKKIALFPVLPSVSWTFKF